MMFGTRLEFEYFECSNCGCLQLSEIPKNIADFYNIGNYHSAPSSNEWLTFWMKKERTKYYMTGTGMLGKIIKSYFPDLSFEALASLKPKMNDGILDVGCGTGQVLHLLSSIGYNNLMGIDPFLKNDINYGKGLTIRKLSLNELSKSHKWKVITLNHVFEHVPDPLETLVNLRDLLDENGTIIIRIPTVSSWAWKNYSKNWYQIDAPRHFFLHSIESMRILINKSQLKLRSYYYDSDEKQFWASEQYSNDIPLNSEKSFAKNPRKSIFNRKEIENFKLRSKQLNSDKQGDQVVFFLQK